MQRSLERDIPNKTTQLIAGRRGPERWAHMIAPVCAIVFVLWGVSALAQAPAQVNLRAFYQQNCVKCHGADGSAVGADGGKLKGQDFTDQEWLRNTEDKEMVDTILNGKFFGWAMPKFKDKLTRQEAQRMVTDVIRKCKKGQVIKPETDTPTGQ